jgi:hypothetical protein
LIKKIILIGYGFFFTYRYMLPMIEQVYV